jgi:DNA-binding PadR family transcriptional regulator
MDVKTSLTLADLVVLSLLAERPMHGYELNRELEYREVRDWAGVSRPQVYYSLKKLASLELLAESAGAASDDDAKGPERRVFAPTAAGRRALAEALARPDWAQQRTIPPFLTWLALSSHAEAGDRALLIGARRAFLEAELLKERQTLEAVRSDVGEMIPAAVLMLEFVVRGLELELDWLAEVARRLG